MVEISVNSSNDFRRACVLRATYTLCAVLKIQVLLFTKYLCLLVIFLVSFTLNGLLEIKKIKNLTLLPDRDTELRSGSRSYPCHVARLLGKHDFLQ